MSAELWLVARATGTWAPSTLSLLQLPPKLREPCDEDDDVLRPPSRGLHQNVGREAVSLCLRDAFLVVAAILFFVLCVYAFFYLNLSTEINLDVDMD
ncbi:hypothetical protein ATANTOWER_000926 [Ataeniobius toweri]|uniref:Triple QxxK/R motif-containing protein n=1 Tax=Ataeniobius toweri TaxID=208326 RepID=A0ABU7BQF1_9TELE|nr:hypothetical protein [Ataeniobius toweri]